MPKHTKAFDWLSMAQEDLEEAFESLDNKRYASTVFRAELSAQKAIKALIVALGFEPGKTHKPTLVLKGLIAGGLIDLREDLMRKVNEAITYAIVLEDQGTTPRYGWETVDRIIKPSEIYSEDIARALLRNAERVYEIVKSLLGEVDC
ncbi:MAG: hypothetical protein DRJ49_05240 [Thermoprotei archaeon]|nr:MAG: hypothetical protein DRN53_04945 [Thermoprotei archaeon]RLE88299.1 MAG: hypothetical protein DRJ49_05240 [Thermoprotei archaeon]